MSTTTRIQSVGVNALTGKSGSAKRSSSVGREPVNEMNAGTGVQAEIENKQPEDYYNPEQQNEQQQSPKEEQLPNNYLASGNSGTNVSEAVEATGGYIGGPVVPNLSIAMRMTNVYETNIKTIEETQEAEGSKSVSQGYA